MKDSKATKTAPGEERITTLQKKDCVEQLVHKFTPAEQVELGRELASLNSKYAQLDLDKKAAVSDFKNRLENCQASISRVSDKLNLGEEYRATDCEIVFNQPHSGWKTVVRKDTGEFVRDEAMTPGEMQMELELNAPVELPETVADAILAAEEPEADREAEAVVEEPAAESTDVDDLTAGLPDVKAEKPAPDEPTT